MKRTISRKSRAMSISIPAKAEYQKDFYQWTRQQARSLKKKDFSHLDIENLVEEIESLGSSEKRALKSYCVVLLTHLLKQKYQPQQDCNSWRSSIANARREIKLLLEYSPSLKKELHKIYQIAYQSAKEDAAYETKIDLKKFDALCPWSIDQALGIEKM